MAGPTVAAAETGRLARWGRAAGPRTGSPVEPATDGEERGDTAAGVAGAGPDRPRRLRPATLGVTAARPATLVVVLALAAGTWAVVGSQAVFPYLSDDHDEGIYLLQADSLADGHLFPPAPEHAAAFLPWLSVISEGRYVVKYTPVHASILAVGTLVGSTRWSLGLIAAGVVVVTYALAREVLGRRRVAALATVFLVLSPVFLVQSATFLPYCSSLLLLEAFTLALLRGLRTDRPPLLAAAGLLFGAALFARPFDAVVFGAPLGLYFVLSQRRLPARLARNTGWFALGAALPVLAMLAYYEAATGSPFRSPFNLLEPRDTLGFGTRKLLPTHPDLAFTPAKGWYGVSRHFLLTSFWCFGGLVLVGFFIAALLGRGRPTGPRAWLALVAVSFSLGYMFFWGTYGTGLRGSLTTFLGPFYFLPVLVPLTFLAAEQFAAFWRLDRALAAFALVGMVVVSGFLLARALQVNLRLSAEDRRLYSALTRSRLDRALVLLPPMYGPHLLHPFAWLRNDPDYDGEVVYALDHGEAADLRLIDDFPGRAAYRLRVHGHYRANPPDPALTSSLQRLRVFRGPALDVPLSWSNPTAEPYVVLSLTRGGLTESFMLDSRSIPGKGYDATISIGPATVGVAGVVESRLVEPAHGDNLLVVAISLGPEPQSLRTVYRRELAVAVEGGELRVLLPGRVTVNELGEEPVERLGPVLLTSR